MQALPQQGFLFDIPTLPQIVNRSVPGLSPDEDFAMFVQDNPAFVLACRQLALDMRNDGMQRGGIKAVFEILRWWYARKTNGEQYSVNNNYASRMARFLMETEPRLAGFFETRELANERSPQ